MLTFKKWTDETIKVANDSYMEIGFFAKNNGWFFVFGEGDLSMNHDEIKQLYEKSMELNGEA